MRIVATKLYSDWLSNLKNRQARDRIAARIMHWKATGKVTGEVKPVGEGIIEAKFDFGAGYRVYFAQKQDMLVLLVYGGDKSSQSRDIKKAQEILADLKNEWRMVNVKRF